MRSSLLSPLAALPLALALQAQITQPPLGQLDPARSATLRSPAPNRTTAEFIWTANDAAAHDPKLQASVRGQDDKTSPHFFRAHFSLTAVPPDATLYLAGPRSAIVFLNGHEVLRADDDGTRPKNLTVLTADVHAALQPGENVLALEEGRGHSSLHTGASPLINQVTYGEVLAAEILPAPLAVEAHALLASNLRWRSTLQAAEGWQDPTFDDRTWLHVESLGVLGSHTDFLQWNADAGLYAWPGYTGISPTLRVFDVPQSMSAQGRSILLDLGREVSGRIRLSSRTSKTFSVFASYGESSEEALEQKSYLGPRSITVPPHATVYGPKSAFRYVLLITPPDLPSTALQVGPVEAITRPVDYLGSFESSDPLVNRIWETSAYTARLCMQEGIWDAPKRDRGRWMGDLDVTGRTITSVFASPETNALQEQTMLDIIGDPPVTRDVNTIAGYSALWITGEANFYRHNGDLAYLRTLQTRLLGLLQVMDAELDSTGLFTNPGKHKVFVDWSADLSSDTPEARAATHFEFALAFSEAAYLLDELGDHETAAHYRAQAARLREAAQTRLLTPGADTFGARWQTNAWAVVSGTATEAQGQSIWRNVLSHINEPTASPGTVITPYQGYYTLVAMAKLEHRQAALDWMRSYWGGMLAEGATSFWEAYDPRWPKQDFHAHLQADNKTGFYVSLAHGWSSGPAAWLAEQVLGIQPTGPGFRRVIIRPDLGGLAWARGSEPTPRGVLRVEVQQHRVRVTLPPGTEASIELPFPSGSTIRVAPEPRFPIRRSTTPEGRVRLRLNTPGTYTFTPR